MRTHINFETAKRIKDFLGESAPEPMDLWVYSASGRSMIQRNPIEGCSFEVPAYKLHDLLSRPFCEAMEKNSATKAECLVWKYILAEKMASAYFNDGLPAVEKLLLEMMRAK